MSTLKEKLSRLGRPLRTITIEVAGEKVDVTYQRPTLVKDRLLREAMQEEYNAGVKTMKAKNEDGKSAEDLYRSEFEKIGRDKVIDILVGRDLHVYAEQATKSLGKERPAEDADEDVKKLWFEEWKPAFDAIIEVAKSAYGEEDDATLVEKATAAQLDQNAKDRAFEIYGLRLIMDSIYDVSDGKTVAVFDSMSDIEETLSADTITELRKMISEEVRKAREVPLTLAEKS